jgi:bacteriocin-type transport-associated protein
MSDVLLRELSNADIDWLVANGKRQNISAETVLLDAGEMSDAIYVLLSGALSIVAPVGGDCGDQRIAQLSDGEIVGESLLLNVRPLEKVIASATSLVLAVPSRLLLSKMKTDIQFSAHFYRAIALIMAERVRKVLENPGQIRYASDRPMKDALLIFGELQDNDVDWLVSMGKVEKIPNNYLLIQAGKPIDAIHVVLDGAFTVLATEGEYNPLTMCFECAEKTASTLKPIDSLTKGEMAGLISFLDLRMPPITLRAAQESLVLTIPKRHVLTHLQQNLGFASRLYRVLSIQLAGSLQSVMSRFGCSSQTYAATNAMDGDMQYDDELDMDSLHQVSQGAARFNWMMKRLGVGSSFV